MLNLSAKENEATERFLSVAKKIDEFEGYERKHAERIAFLADALARKFNFGALDCRMLREAALVHDIGELVMNREYIKSAKPLTENERFDMQRHPVIGEQECAKRGFLRAVQLLVRWHHEWWCGAGFPDALSGEQIPLAARILRVADSYAALTEKRPFRAAFSNDAAKRHLIESAGIEFDPQIVAAFLSLEELQNT